jgi:HK97 family phage prohead protease
VTIEVHDNGPNWWRLQGVTVAWLHRSRPYFVAGPNGTFLEQIATGAFDWSDRTELRVEHCGGPVLAATRAGTLFFETGIDGLLLGAALSKLDPSAVDAIAQIRSRKLTGLSVGIRVLRDAWSTATDGRTNLRTINAAALDEVSIVARPANTSAMISELHREGGSTGHGLEYRSARLVIADSDDDDLERELWLIDLERSRRVYGMAR